MGKETAVSRITTPVSFQLFTSVKSLYPGCVATLPSDQV